MGYVVKKMLSAGRYVVVEAAGGEYKTIKQANRRARDLNRKGKIMPAKASSAVKKSPAKKAAAAAKKAPTKASAPAQSVEKQVAAATEAKAAKAGPVIPNGKPIENGKKNGKATTAVKAPEAAAPKPKLCKAVPKQIDGKPVSNYRGVRLAIEAEGPEAGLAHGLALGLPLSQVKAYVKELVAIIEKAKNKPPKGEKKVTVAERAPYEPQFRFESREKAWSHAVSQARRCGFSEANFHILEEGGKFAVAPISYKPPGEVPTFEKGDTVMDTIIKDSRAKVIEAGPEVCVVEYESKKLYTTPQTIPNVYLYKVSDLEAANAKPAKKAGAAGRRPDAKKKKG